MSTRAILRIGVIAAGLVLGTAAAAHAQLGALVSPGPLARAHASLEGLANCEKCHERGRKVTPAKCLTCHAPIADRIRQKKGVHRNAGADCVTCHVDHAGVDGELRPFDQSGFDHTGVAGFALDGRHAPIASKCAACHKTRSFLTARPSCASCHADTHKGRFGNACERCHSTAAPFAAALKTFDHAVTRFPLSGAHRTTPCASCHTARADGRASYAIARFSTCGACHATPHKPTVSTTCTSCHSTETWKTSRFDHTRTAFPLVGRHQTVACAACHKGPATRAAPAFSTCAACHADPHRGTFKQDCRACHSEKGFTSSAGFDHQTTGFALADKHAGLPCVSCHKNAQPAPGSRVASSRAQPSAARAGLDFRGLTSACASCHVDPHAGELGRACESCHSARTFDVASFVHPGSQALFGGAHATLACAKCHAPASPVPRFKSAPTACAGCHRDVHLGQVGASCEACHSVSSATFAADRFTHDSAAFRLAGAHARLECVKCHRTETAAFPGGSGTAMRLRGMGSTCESCHTDVHLGQVSRDCANCHSPETFAVRDYQHRSRQRDFFVGRHLTPACAACHQTRSRVFPAGRGTAVDFQIGARCVACHTDVHNGALGSDCGACHRPEPLRPSHGPAEES